MREEGAYAALCTAAAVRCLRVAGEEEGPLQATTRPWSRDTSRGGRAPGTLSDADGGKNHQSGRGASRQVTRRSSGPQPLRELEKEPLVRGRPRGMVGSRGKESRAALPEAVVSSCRCRRVSVIPFL